MPKDNKYPEKEINQEPTEDIDGSIHREGTKDFYKLRSTWSSLIGWCIVFLIIFQGAVTASVGFNLINFKDYPWFLEVIVTENFAQIIGLAIIVVKFLFNHHEKNANRP